MCNLVPGPEIQPRPSPLGVQSLSHWTTRCDTSGAIFLPKALKSNKSRQSRSQNTQPCSWGCSQTGCHVQRRDGAVSLLLSSFLPASSQWIIPESNKAIPLLAHGLFVEEADLALNSSKGLSTLSGQFVHLRCDDNRCIIYFLEADCCLVDQIQFIGDDEDERANGDDDDNNSDDALTSQHEKERACLNGSTVYTLYICKIS
ncbi:hypothetical protein MJG53_017964 [Ovis ammon polii x Ovis aries]|uniref:Uncharacterized protein n=1 Tax=Ovis ammon polii x Ovis aries TaxID=2918886 RepID=A0ACB9U5J2_9CETA|nr:hypothetical protein MJG53_017964 [Ovis ammon polii x Ovis aries]